MDVIAALQDTEIASVVQPTITAFSQLMEENRGAISAVPKRTFSFGPSERNKLDVYYPSTSDTTSPVVFFVYGGGFVSGERAYPPPALAYANIGKFYTERGFITVVPDYTLVPNATYPLSAQDVRDAIVWFVRNANEVSRAVQGAPEPDTASIHIISHSAGSVHTWTAFTEPKLADTDAGRTLRACTRTIVLSGTPAQMRDFPAAKEYYGDAEKIERFQPMGLLEHMSLDALRGLPTVVLVKAENEPNWLHSAIAAFEERFNERKGEAGIDGQDKVRLIVAKGHNHISINWALATGEGEQWAEDIAGVFRMQ